MGEYSKFGDVILDVVKGVYDKGEYIKTQYNELDDLIKGLQCGELTLIASRPAMGQTAFALNLALNATYYSLGEEVPVLYITLDDRKETLARRLLSSNLEMETSRMMNGNLSDMEREMMVERAEIMSHSPIFIQEAAFLDLDDISETCRNLKASDNLGLVIVDYFMIAAAADDYQRQRDEAFMSLKKLARELNVPIIVLYQLDHSVDERDDRRPVISDISENIAHLSDNILFIYRDEYYNENSERPRIAEITVAKQRDGCVGMVELLFMCEFSQYRGIYRGD